MSATAQVSIPTTAESLAYFTGMYKNQQVTVACGSDVRGLVYAILELADRVTYSEYPLKTLQAINSSVEKPANAVRSIMRLFVSELEDKSWFYDKEFWTAYLSMLATNRFNRFSLTLGLGYDSPKEVLDSYFIFAYPYLVTVPGYDVRVDELAIGERERNLAMLKFISEETLAGSALRHLEIAEQISADANAPAFRRMAIDVRAQSQIGFFFAHKLRAGTAFMIFEKADRVNALNDAVYFYSRARDSWNNLIEITDRVYVDELGFGRFPRLRGHWKDRLPAIEEDLRAMQEMLNRKTGAAVTPSALTLSKAASDWLTPRPKRPVCSHQQPANFQPGQPKELRIDASADAVKSVKLHYRHVNQVEAYTIENMMQEKNSWRWTIPPEFTDSDYPLMYFFEMIDHAGNAWLFPGYEDNLVNQPYFHLMR